MTASFHNVTEPRPIMAKIVIACPFLILFADPAIFFGGEGPPSDATARLCDLTHLKKISVLTRNLPS